MPPRVIERAPGFVVVAARAGVRDFGVPPLEVTLRMVETGRSGRSVFRSECDAAGSEALEAIRRGVERTLSHRSGLEVTFTRAHGLPAQPDDDRASRLVHEGEEASMKATAYGLHALDSGDPL